MIPEKPYALSCDKNSEPILEALKTTLGPQTSLLEVGAGTAQHAIHMAPNFLNLTWTLSDLEDRHPGMSLWLKDFPRVNIRGPIEYEIGNTEFPAGEFDCVFTANTLHIMSWEKCLLLFDDMSRHLPSGALFMVYGAFNYNGDFTSESNRKFETWLKERDPQSGIRDFERVKSELESRDWTFVKDLEMPANNRFLVFKKN